MEGLKKVVDNVRAMKLRALPIAGAASGFCFLSSQATVSWFKGKLDDSIIQVGGHIGQRLTDILILKLGVFPQQLLAIGVQCRQLRDALDGQAQCREWKTRLHWLRQHAGKGFPGCTESQQ